MFSLYKKYANRPVLGLFAALIVCASPAFAAEDESFPSGHTPCEGDLTAGLKDLSLAGARFRGLSTQEKIRTLHTIAEGVHNAGQPAPLAPEQLRKLGLILAHSASLGEKKLQPYAPELLIIAGKLSSPELLKGAPAFQKAWETFLKNVLQLETPGYYSLRAHAYGTLMGLVLLRSVDSGNVVVNMQEALSYLYAGWKENPDLMLHPLVMLIDTVIAWPVPENVKPLVDRQFTPFLELIGKRLRQLSAVLPAEEFASSFLWLTHQLDQLAASPSLSDYPQMSGAIAQVRNLLPGSTTGSGRPN